MKKKFLAAISAIGIGLVLSACGAPEPDETEAQTTSSVTEDTEDDTQVSEAKDASEYRVGLMIPGNLGDKSFFDAAYNSIEPLENELGVQVEYVECGTDSSKFYPAFVDMCEKGYDLILTISSSNDDALRQIAEEYPDQKFINLDDEMADPPANVYIMGAKNNEMSFLAGAVAALKAQELGDDTVGFVGGMDIPTINEFLIGYIEGVQTVDPEMKVQSSYVGDFNDTAKGKENGLLLYNSGISVVYAAAGQAGLGVEQAPREQGDG